MPHCSYPDYFFPWCSEYFPAVWGAWIVNERAKRGNLLGSSLKLTRESSGRHFPVGFDPETAGGSKSLPEKTSFQTGSQLCRECIREPSPSCWALYRHRTGQNVHMNTHISLLACLYIKLDAFESSVNNLQCIGWSFWNTNEHILPSLSCA